MRRELQLLSPFQAGLHVPALAGSCGSGHSTCVRFEYKEECGAHGGRFELVGQVSVLLKQHAAHVVIRDAFVFVAAGSVRRLAHTCISCRFARV